MKVFIGVAWPYANGPIHVGHVAGSLLPPDIFARYHRMNGNEVLMVSGSDMHGTPITVKAELEGVEPVDIAERYHQMNKKAIEDLGISFDLFAKTHSEEHFAVVHSVFLKLNENGHIYKEVMQAPYCTTCKRFLPDRYVEGECPECESQDARGDQCDECGTTLDPHELHSPRCKICGSEPETRETEHFFFRLSSFGDQLLELLESHPHWRANTKNFTRNWLLEGLKDRAITRDMTWGVPIPLEGYDGKCIYVWFEAVIGYLSTSKLWAKESGDPDAWKAFWEDPDCRHYYFLGKDNIPFHTIIWPAMLMGYGGLDLPYDVPANEFLRLEGEQFSKSRGITIDIPSMLEQFSQDHIRYYLTVNMPENRDSDFTWDDFERRTNTELVANLGNLIHRVLSFTNKHFEGVPAPEQDGPGADTRMGYEPDPEVKAAIENAHKSVSQHLSGCSFKEGMKEILNLGQFGNRFIDSKAPWKLIKEDKDAAGKVLFELCWIAKALAVLSAPYLPDAAQRTWKMLGYGGDITEADWSEALVPVPEGQAFGAIEPLFTTLDIGSMLKDESKPEEEAKACPLPEDEELEGIKMISIEDFFKTEIIIGKIMSVEPHPNADKLYIVKVDLGEEERQLVAGLRPYYEPDEMVGKEIAVVANLQPAKLRGVESQGMLLAAEKDGKVHLLTTDKPIGPGAKIR